MLEISKIQCVKIPHAVASINIRSTERTFIYFSSFKDRTITKTEIAINKKLKYAYTWFYSRVYKDNKQIEKCVIKPFLWTKFPSNGVYMEKRYNKLKRVSRQLIAHSSFFNPPLFFFVVLIGSWDRSRVSRSCLSARQRVIKCKVLY